MRCLHERDRERSSFYDNEIIGGTGYVARLHAKEGGFVRLIMREECQSLARRTPLVTTHQPPLWTWGTTGEIALWETSETDGKRASQGEGTISTRGGGGGALTIQSLLKSGHRPAVRREKVCLVFIKKGRSFSICCFCLRKDWSLSNKGGIGWSTSFFNHDIFVFILTVRT